MSLVDGASSDDEFTFMFSSEPTDPCSVIVEAVAWVTDSDVDDLSSFEQAIDPDALDDLIREMNEHALWRSATNNASESALRRIRFEYADTRITVEPGGFTITRP